MCVPLVRYSKSFPAWPSTEEFLLGILCSGSNHMRIIDALNSIQPSCRNRNVIRARAGKRIKNRQTNSAGI